jgi:hypothetical protein
MLYGTIRRFTGSILVGWLVGFNLVAVHHSLEEEVKVLGPSNRGDDSACWLWRI